MSSPDVIVIGAGVLGLASAAELATRGLSVTVIDPGGPNASAIAAGMIAPAMESLIEDASRDDAALLNRAAAMWPDFAHRHGLTMHGDGTEWRGLDAEGDHARLTRLGFRVERRANALFLPDELRVDPPEALRVLSRQAGVTVRQDEAVSIDRLEAGWSVETAAGLRLGTPIVVVATGAGAGAGQLEAPGAVQALLGRVEPIKGQITRAEGPPPPSTLRSTNVYVAPAGAEILIGADMAWGQRGDVVDEAALAWQLAEAERLLGRPVRVIETRVGVRGASPDDLPMVGRVGEGLFVALAPRRNGWLMAPLAARTIADAVEGRASLPDAAALDPSRFA